MIKKYKEYSDSGIEWMKAIPKHWKHIRLRYVCDITTGNRDTVHQEEVGKYPFFVRSQSVKRINSFSYDGEAILTAGDGDICKIWHHVNEKFDFHQRVYMLYNFNGIIGRFLFYFLKENFIHEVFKLSAKSTVDSLRQPMFLNFPLCLPSLKEQTKISEYLDYQTELIDAIIEKKQQLIKKLKEQRQAIINEAVTKGLNPNVPMKDSGVEWLGEIPEHWEIKPLKSVATCNDETLKDSTPIDLHLKYVEIGSVSLENGIEEIQNTTFKDAPSRARRIVRENDIIISTVRTYLKAIAKIKKEQDGFIASTGFAVIRSKTMISEYLSLVVQSENFIDEIIANSVGVSYPAINASDLMQIKIPVPNKEDQIAISKKLERNTSNLFQSIYQIEKSIETLKAYRQSIISEAVTGKIDVREWEPKIVEIA